MPNYNAYVDYIYTVLRTIKKDVEFTEETDLVAELGLSSLQVMELIEHIEDHFDISISLNILPDINTVGDLARKLQELNG
ncbi:acyl carrier protein [Porticoccus sp.]